MGNAKAFNEVFCKNSNFKLLDAEGNVINRYVYNSFGNIVEKTEGVANPYTYTGREYDAESGLYYYRARYYDSKTGRFISEDPVGYRFEISNLYPYVDSVRKLPLETSLYAYTGNSPINFIDPTGEAAMAVGICVAAMATDIGVTIYAINKYADEMKEIKGKIREIESQCDTLEDEIEHSEKLEELRRQAIKVTEKMIRARGRGYAIGIPIAIFCGVSPFLPF